jgi:hypothetical protein
VLVLGIEQARDLGRADRDRALLPGGDALEDVVRPSIQDVNGQHVARRFDRRAAMQGQPDDVLQRLELADQPGRCRVRHRNLERAMHGPLAVPLP